MQKESPMPCIKTWVIRWWSIGESNPWPFECHSNALPTALMPLNAFPHRTVDIIAHILPLVKGENSFFRALPRSVLPCFSVFCKSSVAFFAFLAVFTRFIEGTCFGLRTILSIFCPFPHSYTGIFGALPILIICAHIINTILCIMLVNM